MIRIIRLFYSLLLLTPLIFTSFNSELFELPKMYFVYLLTILILFFHLLNYLNGHTPLFRRTPLDIPLLLFFLSQLISTIFSVDRHTSIFGYYSRLNGGLLSLASYLLLYWILAIYIDEKLKNRLITVSFLSGLLIAIYGLAQSLGVDRHLWVQDVQNRVFSTLGQPNWLAAYLVILLPLALSRLTSSKNKLQIASYYLLVTIYYLCLLLTKSKSGLLAAAITLGLYFFLSLLKNKKQNLLLLITSYCLLITLSLLVPNPIRDRLFPPKSELQITDYSLLITPSEDIRKIVWTGALGLWRQFPLIGTGPETFAYTYYWTRPSTHNLTSEWDFLYNKAHNEYLNYLATTGALGLLTYLFLIIFISSRLLITDYGLLVSFISVLITNFAGFSVVITSLYFFLLPALILTPITPTTNSPKSIFLKILFVFCCLFLVSKIFSYYMADIAYAQAQTLDNRQQYQTAYQDISSALSLRPGQPIYLSLHASLAAKLALATRDQSYITRALSSLRKIPTLSPFNLNLWKERAQTYYYLSLVDSKYYLESLDALTKASKLAPTDAKTFYLLGQFYQNISQTDLALQNYQQAVQLKSNYDHAYFAIGKIYFEQKKYSEAKFNFENVLKYAPTNPDAAKYLEKIKSLL